MNSKPNHTGNGRIPHDLQVFAKQLTAFASKEGECWSPNSNSHNDSFYSKPNHTGNRRTPHDLHVDIIRFYESYFVQSN